MSEEVSLLSIEQAATQAGVSKDTIERYKDLGLLRIHSSDGVEKFSDEDIKLLFNSKNPSESSIKKSEECSTDKLKKQEVKLNEGKTESAGNSLKTDHNEEELPRLKNIIKEAEEASYNNNAAKTDLNYQQSNQYSGSNQSIDISSIELLELTRSLKDQLEVVKEERNWLRKRIEKLESLSEREQMLRMTESDTIRTLIVQNEKKRKNPLSFLLSWTQNSKEKPSNN